MFWKMWHLTKNMCFNLIFYIGEYLIEHTKIKMPRSIRAKMGKHNLNVYLPENNPIINRKSIRESIRLLIFNL